MIALFSLGNSRDVLFECSLRLPCSAVDALQHWTLFVSAPVRAGNFHQREVTKTRSTWNVRSATQVHKTFSVAIHADCTIARNFARIRAICCTSRYALNNFALVRLVNK